MAQARAQAMAGGMSAINITTANTVVGNYFLVTDIVHTQPMNTAVLGSGSTATTDMKNYGITMAALSQYAGTLSMTDPAALILSIMQDASDGTMNGMMDTTSITMTGMGGGGNTMHSTVGTSNLERLNRCHRHDRIDGDKQVESTKMK